MGVGDVDAMTARRCNWCGSRGHHAAGCRRVKDALERVKRERAPRLGVTPAVRAVIRAAAMLARSEKDRYVRIKHIEQALRSALQSVETGD